MKKIAIIAAVLVLLGFAGVSHASDWDLVGKVLTGVEGARILTGGRVDVIGSVMGISGINAVRQERVIVIEKQAPRRRIWVPEYRMVECGGHWEYESDRDRDVCCRNTRHR